MSFNQDTWQALFNAGLRLKRSRSSSVVIPDDDSDKPRRGVSPFGHSLEKKSSGTTPPSSLDASRNSICLDLDNARGLDLHILYYLSGLLAAEAARRRQSQLPLFVDFSDHQVVRSSHVLAEAITSVMLGQHVSTLEELEDVVDVVCQRLENSDIGGVKLDIGGENRPTETERNGHVVQRGPFMSVQRIHDSARLSTSPPGVHVSSRTPPDVGLFSSGSVGAHPLSARTSPTPASTKGTKRVSLLHAWLLPFHRGLRLSACWILALACLLAFVTVTSWSSYVAVSSVVSHQRSSRNTATSMPTREQPRIAVQNFFRKSGSVNAKSPSVLGRAVDPKVPPFVFPKTQCEAAPPKYAVESAVRVTFDVAATDSDDINKIRGRALSQIVEAMNENTGNLSSNYHGFFQNKNPSFESVSSSSADTAILEPFSLDVVYTFVNPNTPSHREAVHRKCRTEDGCRPSRFRDWNELLYSMRGVYSRGMCRHDSAPQQLCGRLDVANGSLVRHIFLVVAHPDQIPHWLTLSSHVTVVTHAELFGNESNSSLPTLNSHAIESVLHRIPGLSKFFVYFNNDMFWGRHISFFDYFRPLSLERTALRESRYQLSTQSAGAAASNRVSLWFEPIHYFEKPEEQSECILRTHGADILRTLTLSNASSSLSDACRTVPILSTTVFSMHCRPGTMKDTWRRFSNYNKQLIFQRVPGGWPSHSFAHYPRLMDTQVLHQMLERDFVDVAQMTRRHHRRSIESLWTTYVYQYYALGVRRDIDAALVVKNGGWQRPTNMTSVQSLSEIAPLGSLRNGLMPPALGSVGTPDAFRQEVSPGGKMQTSLLFEKLEHDVAYFDSKQEAVYHFCMMTDIQFIAKYQRELENKMKLFVTLNDDLETNLQKARGAMLRLMMLIGGEKYDQQAPWESPMAPDKVEDYHEETAPPIRAESWLTTARPPRATLPKVRKANWFSSVIKT